VVFAVLAADVEGFVDPIGCGVLGASLLVVGYSLWDFVCSELAFDYPDAGLFGGWLQIRATTYLTHKERCVRMALIKLGVCDDSRYRAPHFSFRAFQGRLSSMDWKVLCGHG